MAHLGKHARNAEPFNCQAKPSSFCRRFSLFITPKFPANSPPVESKAPTGASVARPAASAARAYVGVTAALVAGQRDDQAQGFQSASLKPYFITTTNRTQARRAGAAALYLEARQPPAKVKRLSGRFKASRILG